MAVRPSWEGHLRLSLVTCPVALYPATSEAETIRFNIINPQTNNRIRMTFLRQLEPFISVGGFENLPPPLVEELGQQTS